MNEDRPRPEQIERLLHASEQRFRIAETAGGIGWFAREHGLDLPGIRTDGR